MCIVFDFWDLLQVEHNKIFWKDKSPLDHNHIPKKIVRKNFVKLIFINKYIFSKSLTSPACKMPSPQNLCLDWCKQYDILGSCKTSWIECLLQVDNFEWFSLVPLFEYRLIKYRPELVLFSGKSKIIKSNLYLAPGKKCSFSKKRLSFLFSMKMPNHHFKNSQIVFTFGIVTSSKRMKNFM